MSWINHPAILAGQAVIIEVAGDIEGKSRRSEIDIIRYDGLGFTNGVSDKLSRCCGAGSCLPPEETGDMPAPQVVAVAPARWDV